MAERNSIFYFVDELSACAWYRCNVPGVEFQKLGYEVGLDREMGRREVDHFDIIVFLRQCSQQALELMKYAKALGKLVVYDIDDALWEVPQSNPAFEYFDQPDRRRLLEQCIRAADVVTTTTPTLAKTLRGRNPKVKVLPNMLPSETWPYAGAKPQSDGHVVIGWSGGNSHWDDLRILDGTLQQVLDAYPAAEFVHCGIGQVPFAPHPRIRPTAPINIEEYGRVLEQFDIGVAPLTDAHFNQCKSDLKVVEYSMVGIPVVASKVDSYSGFIEPGRNGFLAGNPKDWLKALRRLLDSADLRREIGERAHQAARERLIGPNIGLWQEAYGLPKTPAVAVSAPVAQPRAAVVPAAPTPGKPLPLVNLLPTRRTLIDVVIPVHDCAEYLRAAVESVERQSYGAERIRLIAVDDGSTDDSRRVLEDIRAESPLEMEIVDHERNAGANAARNSALKRSDGEFVYFMDADAMLRFDAFAKLAEVLAHPGTPLDVAFAFSSFRRLWVPNGQVKTPDGRVGAEDVHPGAYDLRRLSQANYISMMSLVKRTALPSEGFDESIERFQDWDMWLTLYDHGYVGAYVPEILFFAYVRGGGISQDADSYQRLQRVVAQKHFG